MLDIYILQCDPLRFSEVELVRINFDRPPYEVKYLGRAVEWRRVLSYLPEFPGSHPNAPKAVGDAEVTDLAWKVGRGHITAKDLVLVPLEQVSEGS